MQIIVQENHTPFFFTDTFISIMCAYALQTKELLSALVCQGICTANQKYHSQQCFKRNSIKFSLLFATPSHTTQCPDAYVLWIGQGILHKQYDPLHTHPIQSTIEGACLMLAVILALRNTCVPISCVHLGWIWGLSWQVYIAHANADAQMNVLPEKKRKCSESKELSKSIKM